MTFLSAVMSFFKTNSFKMIKMVTIMSTGRCENVTVMGKTLINAKTPFIAAENGIRRIAEVYATDLATLFEIYFS